LNCLMQRHGLTQNFVGGCKDVVGNDAQTAIPVVHQPIAGVAAQLRDFVCQEDFKGFLQLQRQNMVRQTPVMARFAGDRGRYGPVFVQEFSVRDTPMVPAVAGQDGIAGVRMHSAFRGAHDAVNIRKSDLHISFQFPRLDMLRMA